MPFLTETAWTLAVWAVPVLLAVTLHEVAHGWVARALGDPTADRLGRLSLNPLRHVDPVGTIAVPALLLVLGGFLFGWAKPVPVVPQNFQNPRRDMALVAVAGPLANLAMAFLWGLMLKFGLAAGAEGGLWRLLQLVCSAGVVINLVLMVLNLLPIPPLDGSRVLRGVLPQGGATLLDRIEPYGLLLLVALLASGWLGRLLQVPLASSQTALFALLGLPPGLFH